MIAWNTLVILQAAAALGGILNPFNWARSDKMEVDIPWLPFENESRCYEELGCLNITRSWYHLIYRPFNVFPLPRSVINTRFILYTRSNPTEGKIMKVQDKDSIKIAEFDAKKPTKFIIHGFLDTYSSSWVGEMRSELLKAEDTNVIVVDWAGGSLPLYTQATANTRLVALEIAHFLKHLMKKSRLKPQNVHMIGHSLGAHTAGYVGSLVPGLGRITGLDPAEPYFQGMPAHVRLDHTDANLVDVIHTDGKSIIFLAYGMSQPCGHLDFYPNNGKEQPGCEIIQTPLVPLTLIKNGIEEASRVLVACNHNRAIKLFIDSINSQCQYIAHHCSSYQRFLAGKCFTCNRGSNKCAIMGYHADKSFDLAPERLTGNVGARYYTTTGKEFPFCQRLYRVSLELAQPPKAENWVKGSVRVTLHSDAGVIQNLDLTPEGGMKLEHGNTHTVVVAHPADLGGDIKKVDLNWEYDINVLEPKSLCLFWCNDHLYIKSVTVDEMELPSREKRYASYSSRLCATNKQGFVDIPNKGKASFYNNCPDPG